MKSLQTDPVVKGLSVVCTSEVEQKDTRTRGR
ncbi:hypothetical protein GGGNBK_18505 [Sporosarcina sp. ANT_H38]